MDRFTFCERTLKKSEGSVERMAQAITEYGFKIPVLARTDGEVVDGRLRLMAARSLGLTEAPVIAADDLSEDQVRAFRLLLMKSPTWAEWDLGAVGRELAELRDLEVDLSLTGFDLAELDQLLAGQEPPGLTDEDAVPETPEEPITRPGDLWTLGRHRLLCGDSTRASDVARLMDGERADMAWTDPPYNVNYEGKAGKILNDHMEDAAFYRFLLAAFRALYTALGDGGAAYVAHADSEGLNFRKAFKDAGFKLATCVIWRKNVMVLGRGDYQCQHEPILYGWRPTGPHRWFGGRNKKTIQELGEMLAVEPLGGGRYLVPLGDEALVITGEIEVESVCSSVVCVDKPLKSKDHPTMKPVALVERFLRNSSLPGQIVLDLFGGSGTTLIACEKTDRAARLMELDPRFCDVIVQRWETFTGKTAMRGT